MPVRVLFIGEIVGKAGIYCIKTLLTDLRRELSVDFVIANGDGVTGGFGIGRNHSVYLRKLGVDVITTGDQVYFKKDMVEHIEKVPYVLRPVNLPATNPGRGWRYYTLPGAEGSPDGAPERRIAVINFLGQSGFDRTHPSNPFTYLPELITRIREKTSMIFIDFHAVTTAEKTSMSFHADGRVTASIGTGTRALSADAAILPGGTAVITDAGRTGSLQSVSGLAPEVEIRKFVQQVPERSQDAWAGLELQGVVVDVDDEGRATAISTLRRVCPDAPRTPEV